MMSLSVPILTEAHRANLAAKIKLPAGLPEHLGDRLIDEAIAEGLAITPENFVQIANAFGAALARRVPGQDKIIPLEPAKCPDGHSAVFIATDDRPFLVASVTAQIYALDIEAEALIHPIIKVTRTKDGALSDKGQSATESVMMIILPKLSPARLERLAAELGRTLSDTRIIFNDFTPMLDALERAKSHLPSQLPEAASQSLDEARAFLDWIGDGNFVLMGVREYDFTRTVKADSGTIEPIVLKDRNLGLLREESFQILRDASETTHFTEAGKILLAERDPLVIAKSNQSSRVHRRVRYDYISVKRYDDKGEVTGESRFIGLFTAAAYNLPPASVPLLREKLDNVRKRSGMSAGSHAAKSLDYVLATFPRDELFQIREDDLLRIATGVVSVLDRPRTRLFVRRDPFDRFASCLLYIPREHYNTELRRRIGEMIRAAFNGRMSAFYPRYADEPVARVHFIIGLDPFNHPEPDLAALERDIAEIAKPWPRRIADRAEEQDGEIAPKTALRLAEGFPLSFRDQNSAKDTLADMAQITALGSSSGALRVRCYSRDGDAPTILRAKFYRARHRLEPSRVMPIFANMGLHVAQETGYKIDSADYGVVWIHDFEIHLSEQAAKHPDPALFEQAILAILSGATDDDSFNALVMAHGLSWRDVAVLRAFCRYRQQSGLDPSEAVQIDALMRYGDIARGLTEGFHIRFDPDFDGDIAARGAAFAAHHEALLAKLETVRALDHDRALRRLADTVANTLRSNAFQRDESGQAPGYISLKIASRELEILPEPRPFREIFVWAPHVEGVHLRFGAVARGGLRWSDRRDDYRTEVLGLVKAQQVKNAVIVPVGSKGGFYPKALPQDGTREQVMEAGIAAYRTYISALLEITDNYHGMDIIAPERTICWDAPDPYLVVAADKGTATFSDIANGIAVDKGFWLGDAFASGGSAGYDHKKMGITARGAWEAVKRHFREMGKDIQSEDFDVIGIGDMSGDVFGNGMLLSEHIRLRAAFNHMHIFIDPEPDVAKSFAERARLFALPRSTWEDYNAELISKGGGIFSRSEKSIKLTEQIKAMTGLSEDEVTPNRLIHALLKSPCELLWFGGIGTYVKAESESHADVGDKANDPIRVDAGELQAKVIGEGANLGLTQAGRIAFAKAGGRLNTDAVDNSAGVDSSDHEVNIKILLAGAIERGTLKAEDRNALLAKMTDDVARLVLAHNYDQTRALSLAQMSAMADHNAYERLMVSLEQDGRLDRKVEGLPATLEMNRRFDAQIPLTRPELAVLMAYAKIRLFDDLLATEVVDDPHLARALRAYFPAELSRFENAMDGHRLRREIIATRLANRIIDVGGPLFMLRLSEATNGQIADIAAGFVIAYDVLGAQSLTENVSALDHKIPAHLQYQLLAELARVIGRVTGWLVRRQEKGAISPRIEMRQQALSGLTKDWLDILSPYDRKRAAGRMNKYIRDGVPEELAAQFALLRSRASGFDVLDFAQNLSWPLRDAAELFYDVGGRFKIDRMRTAALRSSPKDHWDRLALRRITEDFYAIQGQLARHIAGAHMKNGGTASQPTREMIEPWLRDHIPQLSAYDTAFKRLSESGEWTLAKFAIATAALLEMSRTN